MTAVIHFILLNELPRFFHQFQQSKYLSINNKTLLFVDKKHLIFKVAGKWSGEIQNNMY